MEKLDAFVLPGIAVTIILTVAYVWSTWFRKKSDRALHFSEEDGDGFH